MKFSMNIIKPAGFGKMFDGLSDMGKRQALNDSGQIIQNSTKIGYLRSIDPEGKSWPKNPEWYLIMKGNAAVLTGPASKTIPRGKYSKKYEFASVNRKRMKNSLVQNVFGSSKVIVQYDKEAQKRANINQVGGKSVMVLKPVGGGKEKKLNINVQKRPHLGVAEKFPRLGGKTDSDHILDIFSRLVGRAL